MEKLKLLNYLTLRNLSSDMSLFIDISPIILCNLGYWHVTSGKLAPTQNSAKGPIWFHWCTFYLFQELNCKTFNLSGCSLNLEDHKNSSTYVKNVNIISWIHLDIVLKFISQIFSFSGEAPPLHYGRLWRFCPKTQAWNLAPVDSILFQFQKFEN